VHGSSEYDVTQYTLVVVAASGVITGDVHAVDDTSGITRALRGNNARMPLDDAKCRSCSSSSSTGVSGGAVMVWGPTIVTVMGLEVSIGHGDSRFPFSTGIPWEYRSRSRRCVM